jgi:murein DD-endopeptidase MepM/ murein hydrolase activator NlpD
MFPVGSSDRKAQGESRMAKRFFTVLVLPDATSPPKKFHISKTVLTTFAIGAALSLVMVSFFLYQYVGLNVQLLELRRLRREVSDRSVLSEKMQQVQTDLARVRDLDRQVRGVVGLDKAPAEPTPALAQGGDETVSRNALVAALKQRTGQFTEWVNRDLTALGQEITTREKSLRDLKTYLDERAAALSSLPTILPVKGLITAGFGGRTSPFTGKREYHEGLDIAAPYGTPIVATADGVVTFAGPLVAYGNVVFIDHGRGFATFYGHNSSNKVREGQRVRRGDVIAYIGTTGRTTGPHVHYEVHVNGVISNPLKYAVETSGVKFASDVEAENPS